MITSRQNLKMVDFASRDARSASAMLRGKGDGREKKWLEFSNKNRDFFSEEELHEIFKKECQVKPVLSVKRWTLGQGVLAMGIFLAVVF